MKKMLIFVLLLAGSASAQVFSYNGWCQSGGQGVITQGLQSAGTFTLPGGSLIPNTGVQASYPSCRVTVYNHGTTIKAASVYQDESLNVLPNPFSANTDGSILFFVPFGCYDIVTDQAGMPASVPVIGYCVGGSGNPGSGNVIGNFTAGLLPVATGGSSLGNSALFDDGTSFGNLLTQPRSLVWGNIACSSLDSTVRQVTGPTGEALFGCSSMNHSFIVNSIGSSADNLRSGLTVIHQDNQQQTSGDMFGMRVQEAVVADANTVPGYAYGLSVTGTVSGGNGITMRVINSQPHILNGAHLAELVNYHGMTTSSLAAGTTIDQYYGMLIGATTNLATIGGSVFLAHDPNTFQYSLWTNASVAQAVFRDLDSAQQSGVCHGIGSPGIFPATLHDCWYSGNGSPNGAVSAKVGSIYSQRDGGSGTSLWVKESGTGSSGWSTVLTSPATSAPVLTASATFSSVDLLAATTSPKTIIGAPGAGKVIVPISVQVKYTFGGTAYANVAGGTFWLTFNNNYPTADAGPAYDASGLIDSTTDQIRLAGYGGFNVSAQPIKFVNQPLTWQYVSGSGNPTLGNGTLMFTLVYTIQNF
jgi:hypothetical protein